MTQFATLREQVLAGYESTFNTTGHVHGLFGKHRPLSNFHKEPFLWSGVLWPASENAYMAAKRNPNEPDSAFALMDPKDAKTEGRKVALCANWEKDKLLIMQEILTAKFRQCPVARQTLKDTKTAFIEETNWWGDSFWGCYQGAGENHLGKILTRIRALI
jgi:N-glycosidase YbiA